MFSVSKFLGAMAFCLFAAPLMLCGGTTEKTTDFYRFNQNDEEWHLWQKDIADMTSENRRAPLVITFKKAGRVAISERERARKGVPDAVRMVIECELVKGEAEVTVFPLGCSATEVNGFSRKLKKGFNRVEIDFGRVLPADSVINSVEFKSEQPGTVIVLKRGSLVRRVERLAGVDVGVETNSPVHHVSPADVKEKLRLKLTNRASEAVKAEFRAKIVSFFGNGFEMKTRVAIEPGESMLLPVADDLPEKGLYLVNYELSADGEKSVSGETRFVVFDPVGVTAGRGRGFLFGSHTHAQLTPFGERDLEFYSAALIGVKILRLDVAWAVVESQEGVFDFSHYDEWLAGFDKYHLEAECLMGLAPKWAEDPNWVLADPTRGKPGNLLPRDEPWSRFLNRFASRYKGKVRFYELYNEPDLCEFGNFSAKDFIRSYNAGAAALHAANPEAKVMAGFATIRTTVDPKTNFYPEAVAKTLPSSDLLGLHEHGGIDSYSEKIDGQWLPIMRKAGAVRPIYSTETSTDMTIGESAQAASVFQKLLFAWSRGAIAYNWFKIRNDEYKPNALSDFGMLSRDFYPKAVYAAYNELIRVYSGAEYVRELPRDGMRLLLFKRDGRRLLAGWSHEASPTGTVLLKTDARQAFKIDLMGNRSEVPVKNGMVLFAPGKYPATLELDRGEELSVLPGELISGSVNGIAVPGAESDVLLELFNPSAEKLTFGFDFVTAAGLTVKPAAPVSVLPGERKKIEFKVQVAADFVLPRMSPGAQDTFRVLYRIAETDWRGELVMPVNSIAKKAPIGEFSAEPQFVLDRQEQQTTIVGFNPAEDDLRWKGPADLSGKVYLAIKDDALNVRVSVTDDIHSVYDPGELMWQGDSVQIDFAVPHQRGRWGFGATLYDGKSRVWCWESANDFDRAAAARAVTAKIERRGDQTEYFMSFPLKMLGLSLAQAAKGIKLNVQINDNDGNSREGWLVIDGVLWDDRGYPSLVFLPETSK
ncbi:MAG: sugar-binding protein [Victivallaceae bacterium]|nr:sugar-binding protein [Victivallaceae bacterium]